MQSVDVLQGFLCECYGLLVTGFIEVMPISDSKYIRTFMAENEPRLDLTREIIAPSGEKVSVNIAFGVEFFRPFF